MRVHTLFAVALTMLAPPVGAAEPPAPAPPRTMPTPVAPGAGRTNEDPAEPAVCFEVRALKAPAGFCERIGLKTAGDAAVLSEAQLRRALEAAEGQRDATVTQLPKITVDDGQTAQVRTCETRDFVTGIEAVSVKGATVLVPKNKSVELGDSLAITGRVSADGRSVRVEGGLTRVRLEGNAELVPVVTQITPVFEGGSQGTPIPFTQYLQVPNVRTEKAEKAATVHAGGTLVLGGWTETEPGAAQPKGKGLFRREKKEKPVEYEVVVFATVRVFRTEPASR
ncbi:MAG: hypothetical protein J0I06_13390 [Planctomycetes bacterium]|nr:hypothetical protein [Planctomycetota bacterium]